MRWRTRAGDEVAAQARRAADQGHDRARPGAPRSTRAASGSPRCCAAADQRLTEVRRGVPDAGGLVIATDQDAARAYAKTLREITGEPAVVVLSDDDGAVRPDRASSPPATQRWMVAVRMVSEGVDVPRLAVGVYATVDVDPAVLRPGRRPFRPGPAARRDGVGLPARPCRTCSALADELEVERDHALDRPTNAEEDGIWTPEDALVAAANRAGEGLRRRSCCRLRGARGRRRPSTGCSSTAASSARRRRSAASEEQDYLGLPGLLEPEQVTALLRQRQAEQVKAREARRPRPRPRGTRTPAWTTTGAAPLPARSSTPSSRPGRAARASPTGWCTPSCAAGAAARRWRWRARRRSRRASALLRKWFVGRS